MNDSLLSNNVDQEVIGMHPGILKLSLIGIGKSCRDTFTRLIEIDSHFAGIYINTPDSICEGEKITFTPLVDRTADTLVWIFGKHQTTHYQAQSFTHAFDEAGIIPITLVTRYRVCPDTFYTEYVHVYPNPDVFLGDDSIICYQGNAVVIENLSTSSSDSSRKQDQFFWSTGDTSARLKVTVPGIYTLKQVSQPLGCTGYGSVEITKDCFVDIPNAFTPNGDGVNDYFFPRAWLSKGVENFKLQIYNRWGQLIFETMQKEGFGWDGKYNGKEQPVGVYIYKMNVVFKNGAEETYNGNVTLLR